ncbi:MAG: 50S ribosomal protein L6 [Lentisphaerae bacterium]|nr:50S ribosomal protein L6 [Lentisphaerota bacterium]
MSRIGKQPVDVPSGVTVRVDGSHVFVKGSRGELDLQLPHGISAQSDAKKIEIVRSADTRDQKSAHGLTRSLIANMIEGVVNGYRKELAIEGVGFKAAVQGGKLSISLGFSSPIEYEIPEGIKITVNEGTKILIEGSDKQRVGDCAARIRSFYPVEPYKGKGVRYSNEHVRRKVGKTVA